MKVLTRNKPSKGIRLNWKPVTSAKAVKLTDDVVKAHTHAKFTNSVNDTKTKVKVAIP